MELSPSHIWLIIGLVMLLAELVSVTLVFVFIALGALITASLVALGWLDSVLLQVITFAIASLFTMIFLRKQAKQWVNKSSTEGEYQEYTGESAMVIKDIPTNGEGRIFYRGTEWIALSVDATPISAGSKVLIERIEGIKLYVKENITH